MLSMVRATALTAGLAALGAVSSGPAARANIISDFSGICFAQCTGTATGVLTLTDAYVPGTDVTTADFVSFGYTSSDTSFTIGADGVSISSGGSLSGGLNADGSFNAAGDFFVQSAASAPLFFESKPGEFVAAPPGDFQTPDIGFTFTFSPLRAVAVPEPGSLALLAMGLVGLGLALRTRRTNSLTEKLAVLD